MAREINLHESTKLDADDRRYLRERPWIIAEWRRQGFGDEMDAVLEDKDYEPISEPAPDNPRDVTTTQAAQGNLPPTRTPADDGVTPNDGDSSPEAETDDYPSWNKQELIDEVEARNQGLEDDAKMAKSGTKEELIERLRTYDAQEA